MLLCLVFNRDYLEENTCARVLFLIKLQALGLQRYEKRDSGTAVVAASVETILWKLSNKE